MLVLKQPLERGQSYPQGRPRGAIISKAAKYQTHVFTNSTNIQSTLFGVFKASVKFLAGQLARPDEEQCTGTINTFMSSGGQHSGQLCLGAGLEKRGTKGTG